MDSCGVHCQVSNTTMSLQESGECICREGWSGEGCCSGEISYDYDDNIYEQGGLLHSPPATSDLYFPLVMQSGLFCWFL